MFLCGCLAFACVLIIAFVHCQNAQVKDIQIQYYGIDESERGLPPCGDNSTRVACSALYRRWWSSDIAVRLCRCPRRIDCEIGFKFNQNTAFIDNRSQLKFCYSMERIAVCEEGQIALVVDANYPLLRLNQFEKAHHDDVYIEPPRITALCHCPQPHYYKAVYSSHNPIEAFNETSSSTSQSKTGYMKRLPLQSKYTCNKLSRCHTNQFCGYSRIDINSIYYRCSCPAGDLCIHSGGWDQLEVISELLFVGLARRAYCQPYNDSLTNDYD